MNGYLVRIGIDQAYGNWNGPVNPYDNKFIYVPIPENQKFKLRKEMVTTFDIFVNDLTKFCVLYKLDLHKDLRFPELLDKGLTHLDPDFRYSTYGDNGKKRGSGIAQLNEGDIIAFYAGLRPICEYKYKLLYALIGLIVVDTVKSVNNIPKELFYKNAHTRKTEIGENDIVVFGKKRLSGRLTKCVPIGEWRKRAYRVNQNLLEIWGGLSVENGYIQRSVVPPKFNDTKRFYNWFLSLKIPLINQNN